MMEWLWLALALAMPMGLMAGRGAKMGVKRHDCDDGKSHLRRDWDGNFEAFTCAEKESWKTDPSVEPIDYSIPNLDIPNDGDNVYHHCMNESIRYEDKPPLRGDHRPIWARFGEYLYLPPQRWLHNLEHGSIVMLYHPCADEEEVWKLRRLVSSCLYRHVITPYAYLEKERPLALLSWGSKLSMSSVDPERVKAFIRKHATVAPENLSKDGGFDHGLLKAAEVISDIDDSDLCPQDAVDRGQHGPEDSPQVRVKRRGDPNIDYYQRVYLAQLARFNGPKYASAILNQFRQPQYVMAGTYLGKDPLNPQSVPHTPQPKRPQQQAQFPQQGQLDHGNTGLVGQSSLYQHPQSTEAQARQLLQ